MKKFPLFILAFFFSFTSSAQPLSGAYTIGGTSPSYATFTAAATALINNGVSGPVTFNVRNGTYAEQVNLTTIAGVSNTNTITFQSENNDSSLVTLQFTAQTASANYVFQTFVSHIILKKMTLQGPATGTYTNVLVGVNGAGYIQVQNCALKGHTNAPSTTSQTTMLFSGVGASNVMVTNSYIVGGYIGLYCVGGTTANPDNAFTISGNTFLNSKANAIAISVCNGLQITNNTINTLAITSLVSAISAATCPSASITKNKISVKSGYGIQFGSSTSTSTNRALIANNFISVSGGTTSKGISLTSSVYTDIFHNSIYTSLPASGAGEGIIIATSGSMNNRIQNNSVVSMNSTAAVTAAAATYSVYSYCCLYTGGTPPALPPYSIWADPQYNSTTDLHVQNSVLNNIGTPLSSVTTDIDGDVRSLTTPDIGADEYAPVSLNSGIDAVVSPNNLQINCNSNFNIVLSMTNYGTVPITSALVKYKINGVLQTTYNWSGSLAPGGQTQFTPGTITLLPLQANSIQAWTESPNGGIDGLHSDDSASVSNLYLGMSGVYTIGGSSPNFTTINSAAAMLSSAGVCGAVTMNIRNGTYNEAITQNSIPGASANNTIVYQSESGDSSQVNITWTTTFSQNKNFIIDQANYLTLRKLTFTQPSSPYNYAMITVYHNRDFMIESCVITGHSSAASDQTQYVISATPDSNIVIRNNKISNGNYTVSISHPFAANVKNLSITNNNILGGRSIYLGYITQTLIDGNTISTGGTLPGIYMVYCSGYNIGNNRISIAGADGCAGIYLQTCGAAVNADHIVWNNSVNVNAMAGTTAPGYGLRFVSCGGIKVYHNTVRYNSTDADHIAVGMETSTGADLRNNIFACSGQSKVFYFNNSLPLSSDHNVIFTNGPYVMTTYPNLAAFTAYTGTDSNSLALDPQFTTALTDSLYIGNPLVKNICPPIGNITTDIHHALRSTNAPDPGAFETMTIPTVALGNDTLVCPGYMLNATNSGSNYLWSTGETSQSISVQTAGTFWVQVNNPLGTDSDTIVVSLLPQPVVNAGTDTIICPGENVQLNGIGGVTCEWSVLNGAGFSTTYSTAVTPSSATCYVIMVNDANSCTNRDTICVNLFSAPAVPVINQIGSDLQSTSASSYQWYLNGSIISGANSQTFTPLQGGNYTVIITDVNGCISATSAPYAFSSVGLSLINSNEISIGPNPVLSDELMIYGNKKIGVVVVELHDMHGALVKHVSILKNEGTIKIDMSELRSGIYILTMISDKEILKKKIVKE